MGGPSHKHGATVVTVPYHWQIFGRNGLALCESVCSRRATKSSHLGLGMGLLA